MNNQKKSVVDVAKANKLGIKLQIIIVTVLTISYLIQLVKGDISIGNLVILLLALWVPVVGAVTLNKKDPASDLTKHIIGVGYGIFYLLICIISDQQLVFTYAFPMLLVVAIYCDMKFSTIVASAITVVSVIHAVICTVRNGFTPLAITALEIQVAATILISVYSIVANNFIVKVTGEQMDAINEAGEKTEKMLSEIVEVSNTLADQVSVVSDKLTQLETSSEETLAAMQEVQAGTGDSAEAVQNQLHKTEDISGQIETVTLASENIGNNVTAALTAIKEGQNNINKLIDQSKASEEAANGAVHEVEELKASTDKMEAIVEMISNVASQTSLLALNASIEAARAGEAGRGFSVVATEISNLAAQTQTATEDINNLISNIAKEMTSVANAITKLVENNKIQNEAAKVTADSFVKIVSNSDEIKNDSEQLSKIVNLLEKSNHEIVESIQTISAITEEVTAHASTTCDTTEANREIVRDVKDIVEEMTANADRLKNVQ